MKKHEAKRIARSYTKRKTISDIEALVILCNKREKENSSKIEEAITVMEKHVLGGSKVTDCVVFVDDMNETACYKFSPEESYREPYRSLIDEWGTSTILEQLEDIIDTSDVLDWNKDLELLAA